MVADKRFIPGSFYRRCDRTGFKERDFGTKKEWNGLWVREESWEPRQPQDFVRGVYDDQRVEEPRVSPTPRILGALTTTLTADAAAGATTLTVDYSVRMGTGDTVEVFVGLLDGGTLFRTTLINVPDSVTLVLAVGLPRAAYIGAQVSNLTAQARVSSTSL